jgi:hypothetical protein
MPHRRDARYARVLFISVLTTLCMAVLGLATAPARAASAGVGWSGYVASGGDQYLNVTASWTTPTLSCTPGASDLTIWAGLDGYGDSTVEQVGLDAACDSGGQVDYSGFYELYPQAPVYFDNPIAAGDVLTATVSTGTGPANAFTFTLTDTTQGWTRTGQGDLAAQLGSAEIVAAPLGATDTTPGFASVQVTGARVDGQPLAAANPTPQGSVSPIGPSDDSFTICGTDTAPCQGVRPGS